MTINVAPVSRPAFGRGTIGHPPSSVEARREAEAAELELRRLDRARLVEKWDEITGPMRTRGSYLLADDGQGPVYRLARFEAWHATTPLQGLEDRRLAFRWHENRLQVLEPAFSGRLAPEVWPSLALDAPAPKPRRGVRRRKESS